MQLKTRPVAPGVHRAARAWRAALLAMLGAVVLGPASAGVAGVMSTTVTTLSTNVTYATVSKSGEPLVTYIGYNFTTTYSGKNTTNNVRLEGEIESTNAAELVTLDTANSPSFCRTEPLTNKIVKLICDIGQVRAKPGATEYDIQFQVFFKAPRKADADGPDGALTLTGTTLYAEISDGAGNTNNSSAWTGQTPVALGTINNRNINSVLPKSGGSLYSGDGGVASPGDLFATSVVADNFAAFYSYTNTTIDESEIASCLNTVLNNDTCYELELTIVDAAGNRAEFYDRNRPIKPLSITLTIDGAVSKGVNPSKLTITYDGVVVGLCPAKDVALADQPCLNGAPERIRDKKNPDIDGDIRVNILNFRNGSYRVG